MKRGIPFSTSILSLIMLVVVPLAAILLALGWRAANTLEGNVVALRMAALNAAVTNWMTGGVRVVTSVSQALGEAPSFRWDAGRAADVERFQQLAALLARHPVAISAYAGYEDDRFIYVGRTSSLSQAQRSELGAPDGDSLIARRIEGEGTERRETWWFIRPDGQATPEQTRPTTYDPRTRPWYRGAVEAQAPALTDPYQFTQLGVMGVTLGTPIKGGGVFGIDFPLTAVSRLIGEYKISDRSIVVVATGSGQVIGDTAACPPGEASCTVRDAGVREMIRQEVIQLAGRADGTVDREIKIGGMTWKLLVDSIPPILGQHFAVGAAVPVADISAASRVLTERSLAAGILAVLVAIAAGFGISRLLSRSIARIAVKTERIRNLDFSDRQPVTSRIREILQLSNSVERMRDGLEIFGRYVSKDLVRQIMRSPENAGVGGVRRELTVMFTDIEGFSRLSEGMPPELLTSRLSRYFDVLAAPIVANHGTIDKFIGDSIMAFWNAPEPDPDHVLNACRAALDAAAVGRSLAGKWHGLGRPGFRTRFGLHTGPAVVGNVGARDRINYTLVGAVANQASRLEGLNKMYGTEILASGEVAQLTAERLVWRHIDRVVPAGTTEALDIYEPLGGSNSSVSDSGAFLARWNVARKDYVDGRFTRAIEGFREAAALKADDGPCRMMIERCERLARSGRPDGWDGVWHFERK